MKILILTLSLIFFPLISFAHEVGETVPLHIVCKSEDLAKEIFVNLDPTPPKMDELQKIYKDVEVDCLLRSDDKAKGKLIKQLVNGNTIEVWEVESLVNPDIHGYAVIDK